jgi:hypothetical protein
MKCRLSIAADLSAEEAQVKSTQRVSPSVRAVALLGLAMLLAGCGSSGSDDNGAAPAPLPVGGVDVGVLTGFGSLKMDDATFSTDDQTRYFLDGVEYPTEAAFKAALGGSDDKVGIVAAVQLRSNVSGDVRTGTAARVDARTVAKGPVTSIDPLQVLGQDVVLTGDTVLANLASPAQLAVGTLVEISGFVRDGDNVILATRLERKTTLEEWKLTGFVTASSGAGFEIGRQAVSLAAGAIVSDCGATVPPVGRLVETKSGPAFSGGVMVATRVECRRAGLGGELGGVNGSALPARIEGFITEYDAAAGTLVVGSGDTTGQAVLLTATTTYRDGTVEDLAVGEKVQVTGRLDTATGVLTATRVSFRQARFRIAATLAPANVDPAAATFTLLGVTIRTSALLRDEDGLAAGGSPARDVLVRGFVDRSGEVFATRLEDRGSPGDDDLRLRGPARNIDATARTFTVLGRPVTPTDTTLYRDRADAPISAQAFFGALVTGQQVQVKRDNPAKAVLDDINPPTEIELED